MCILNESNKHLRLQALNGFYILLNFENLVEQASKLEKVSALNNFDAIAKCLWHSLWFNNSPTDSNLSEATLEERARLIEIFYLLIQKDEAILDWLFSSLEESIEESSKSSLNSNYLTSFKLIGSLTLLNAKNDKIESEKLVGSVINIFKKLINNLKDENSNLRFDFIQNLLETFTNVIHNLNKNQKDSNWNFESSLFDIMNTLLDIVMTQTNPITSSQILTINCSLVFKAFALK